LLSRLGPFGIPNGAELKYASGQTRGLVSMPLQFEAPIGARVEVKVRSEPGRN
jgi:hypothetical protein